jgi:hypothetical protein
MPTVQDTHADVDLNRDATTPAREPHSMGNTGINAARHEIDQQINALPSSGLTLPADARQRFLDPTPGGYTGVAEELASNI